MTAARRALEDTGGALLAHAEEEFHKEAIEAAIEAAERAALEATAEATADAKEMAAASTNEAKEMQDRLNAEASAAFSAAAAAAKSAASALAVAETRPTGFAEQEDVAELTRRMDAVAVQDDVGKLSRRLEAEIEGRQEDMAEVVTSILRRVSEYEAKISKEEHALKAQYASLSSVLTGELQTHNASIRSALTAEIQARRDAEQCHEEALRKLERALFKETRSAISSSENATEAASASRVAYESPQHGWAKLAN
jgi:hypothetical protein